MNGMSCIGVAGSCPYTGKPSTRTLAVKIRRRRPFNRPVLARSLSSPVLPPTCPPSQHDNMSIFEQNTPGSVGDTQVFLDYPYSSMTRAYINIVTVHGMTSFNTLCQL
ncbi:hypothetical protein CBL_06643 [Carabus blaptoides fortunei]